jgi:ATP-dependent RNA helicase DDX51/DBP6
VCVCAATGSGKTLAYALPIVQSIIGRTVCRLRAVIVLPSRDLAQQVMSVIKALAAGTDVRVKLCVGTVSYGSEKAALMQGAGS